MITATRGRSWADAVERYAGEEGAITPPGGEPAAKTPPVPAAISPHLTPRRLWKPPAAKRIDATARSENGFLYHATNEERAGDISVSGKLKTHRPHEFTDQDSWPDGSTEKRHYWTANAGSAWKFSPEDGKGVILRAKTSSHPFRRESTGDYYSTKPIPAHHLEILGEDDAWRPLEDHFKTHERHVADALAAGHPVPPEVLADYPDLMRGPARMGRSWSDALARYAAESTVNHLTVDARPSLADRLKSLRRPDESDEDYRRRLPRLAADLLLGREPEAEPDTVEDDDSQPADGVQVAESPMRRGGSETMLDVRFDVGPPLASFPTSYGRSWADAATRYADGDGGSAESPTKRERPGAAKPASPTGMPKLPKGLAPPAFPDVLPTEVQLSHPSVKWAKLGDFSQNKLRRGIMPDGGVFYDKSYPHDQKEAHIEAATSGLLRYLGFDNVPPGEARGEKGDRGYLIAHAHGHNLGKVMEPEPGKDRKEMESLRKKMIAANPPEKMAKWLTASWLLNCSDRHESNYIVGPSGVLHPIDFGHSLSPLERRESAWPHNQDALIMYGLVRPHQPLDKDFLMRLAVDRGRLIRMVDEKLPDDETHPWKEKAMRLLRDKFAVIDRLLEHENPTLGDLPKDESGRLSYNESGLRRPNFYDAAGKRRKGKI